jgi:hypothetical protein
MAAYFFASQVDIDVRLEGEDTRKQVDVKSEKDPVVSAPVFFDGDSLVGQVRVQLLASSHTECSRGGRLLCVCATGRSSHMTASRSSSWAA